MRTLMLRSSRYALVVAVLIVGAVTAFSYLRHETPATQSARQATTGPSLYDLSSIWITDDGRQMPLSALRGNCQILAFMFTKCSGICPMLIKELQTFDKSLPKRIDARTHFTLVTLDPSDTTAELRKYRQTMQLNERWILLRSAPESVRELAAVLGFNYEPQGDQFAHGNLLWVLNPDGAIIHEQQGAGGDQQELLSAVERANAGRQP